ncbi:MAG: hypothetical protein JKX87_04880 [Cycloclasticus sp.]|nr:hypothetical protein [Cycloclasticus sp.]
MKKPWVILVLLNLIVLCAFLMPRFFLAGRYPIALALTLALALPFIAHSIFKQFRERNLSNRHKVSLKIVGVLFILLSIDGLVSTGASKSYLKDAGQWIAASQTTQQSTLFTNNQSVSFYAGSQNGKRIREHNFNAILQKIKNNKS